MDGEDELEDSDEEWVREDDEEPAPGDDATEVLEVREDERD